MLSYGICFSEAVVAIITASEITYMSSLNPFFHNQWVQSIQWPGQTTEGSGSIPGRGKAYFFFNVRTGSPTYLWGTMDSFCRGKEVEAVSPFPDIFSWCGA
jgi:hypothetical protein